MRPHAGRAKAPPHNEVIGESLISSAVWGTFGDGTARWDAGGSNGDDVESVVEAPKVVSVRRDHSRLGITHRDRGAKHRQKPGTLEGANVACRY